MSEFEGQVAIITGGARGIGAEIARRLERGGETVVCVDVLETAEIVDEIGKAGGTAEGRHLDVTDADHAADHRLAQDAAVGAEVVGRAEEAAVARLRLREAASGDLALEVGDVLLERIQPLFALPLGVEKKIAEVLPGELESLLPFEVSDADTMMSYIAPHASKPLDVTIFTREGCPFCVRAKGMLHDAGIKFEELVLNRHYTEASIRAVSGETTVPQVFVNGERIGGSEALEAWLNAREKKVA